MRQCECWQWAVERVVGFFVYARYQIPSLYGNSKRLLFSFLFLFPYLPRNGIWAKMAFPNRLRQNGTFLSRPSLQFCSFSLSQSCYLINLLILGNSNFFFTVFCLHVMAISKNFRFGLNKLVYTPFYCFGQQPGLYLFFTYWFRKVDFSYKNHKSENGNMYNNLIINKQLNYVCNVQVQMLCLHAGTTS